MLNKINNIVLFALMLVSIISAPAHQDVNCYAMIGRVAELICGRGHAVSSITKSQAENNQISVAQINKAREKERLLRSQTEAMLAKLPEGTREFYGENFNSNLTKLYSSYQKIHESGPKFTALLESGAHRSEIMYQLAALYREIGLAIESGILAEHFENRIAATLDRLHCDQQVKEFLRRAEALQLELIASNEEKHDLRARVGTLSRELSRARQAQSQSHQVDDEERWLLCFARTDTRGIGSSGQ